MNETPIRVGQIYQDRDYANAVEVWSEPDEKGSQTCIRIDMRWVEVVEVASVRGPDYVKVRQVVGKRPGHETWMKAARLLGKSKSQGFDLIGGPDA